MNPPFTKVCNSGEAASEGDCPADPSLGSGPNDWACTRDNVTGLIWEVKTTDSGLRDMNHTYTWYMTGSPDGNNGTNSDGTCQDTGRCDTEKFVEDVNAGTGLCGATDWRMPTIKELEGIADLSRTSPTIDVSYFPNTPSNSRVWSGSPFAVGSDRAWGVTFGSGRAFHAYDRSDGKHVRLVRAGQ